MPAADTLRGDISTGVCADGKCQPRNMYICAKLPASQIAAESKQGPEEEEKKIHALLKKVCGDRPPQMSDYLQMCDITNDDIDLGKVHHEAEIRWSKD